MFLAYNSEASVTTKVTNLRPRSVIKSSMQTDITYLKALVYISPYDMVTITFTRALKKECPQRIDHFTCHYKHRKVICSLPILIKQNTNKIVRNSFIF